VQISPHTETAKTRQTSHPEHRSLENPMILTNRNHNRNRTRGVRSLATALVVLALALPTLAAESLRGTININTATAEQLEMLPGIGESRAKAVVDARKRSGGFKRVDDLLAVTGIGEASLDKLRPFLTLEGKTTAKRE
jgi:competence protein ComEA